MRDVYDFIIIINVAGRQKSGINHLKLSRSVQMLCDHCDRTLLIMNAGVIFGSYDRSTFRASIAFSSFASHSRNDPPEPIYNKD